MRKGNARMELETKRLQLRPWLAEDAGCCGEIRRGLYGYCDHCIDCRDPLCGDHRFGDPQEKDREERLRLLLRQL